MVGPHHHLVALPYPGRGHINPMLTICDMLLSRAAGRLRVTFVLTEEWLGLLGTAAASPPRHPGVRFRTLPNVIPSELNRGADFVGFLEAVFTRMEGPFEELLGRLQQEGEPPVRGIIADTYLPWAVAVGNRRGVPVYSLFTMSATFFSVLYHLHLTPSSHRQPLLRTISEKRDESLDSIPGISSLKMQDIHSICSLEKPLEIAIECMSWVNKAHCLLFTSFYELEPRTMDTLKAAFPFPVYAVGPSIPYMTLQDKPTAPVSNGCDAAGYYTWLDSQPRGSILYVSLGSFLSVSSEQMDEIATGLRASGVRFLWVARRDPSRMQELGGSMGLVVPWCDQLRVLCHPSVGGFLTHCGWNSTLEAVYAGMPMLTFPIFWDQPPDSRLAVNEWKVGLSLKGEAVGGGVVGREEIARTVGRLMDLEGEQSKELRRRAGELKEACQGAVRVGGSSNVSLDALMAHIVSGNRG